MNRWISTLIGVLLVAAGVVGLLGVFTTEGKLFGVFAVNFWHNLAHLGVGVLGLLAAYLGESWSRIFLLLFGIASVALLALGIYYGEDLLFGVLADNPADQIFRGVSGVGALYASTKR